MIFLLVLAAGRQHAHRYNFRPGRVSTICDHGRSVLQNCWACYNEIALQWAIGLVRAS